MGRFRGLGPWNRDQTDLLRVFCVLVGTVCLAALLSRGVFLRPGNLTNLAQQNDILCLLAITQFVIVVTGGIDLSVGAVVALSSVLVVSYQGLGLPGALCVGLLGGAVVGLVNGLLVSVVRLPAFVVTLAVMQIVYSVAKVITRGGTVHEGARGAKIANGLLNLYTEALAGIPKAFLMVTLAALGVILYFRMPIGHFLYAIGGNESAAQLSGVRVRVTRIVAYVVASTIAALAGILFVARVGYGDPQAGLWLPLDSIAAVSIGGASLTGGRGTVLATVFGVLIIGVLNNTMNLLGVAPTFQPAVKGAIILITVFIYMRHS